MYLFNIVYQLPEGILLVAFIFWVDITYILKMEAVGFPKICVAA
jgi:hypothetical protein